MTSEGRPLLSCRELSIGYAGQALLPPLSLEVRAGELLLVVGRNGAGKSTWLKTALGLLPPVAGTLRLARPRPRLAYVPQQASLDPILPVRAREIAGWGRLRGWGFLRPLPTRRDREARRRALHDAEASDLSGCAFRELSGGQRQRVLFARMLAGEADLVFLDEPTASMDATSEREAYARLARLARERNAGVVVVTHTLGLASGHADRVLYLDRGERFDEAVVRFGAPEEVFADPRFVSQFGRVEAHGE